MNMIDNPKDHLYIKVWVQKMVESNRLKLDLWQAFTHYAIVTLVMFVPLFILYDIFRIYILKTYDGVRTAYELIMFALPWTALGVVIFFLQRSRLKFKTFIIDSSDEEIIEALERTKKELKWVIEYADKTYIRARRPWNWTGSWGEMITIIRLDDRLLMNSICNPDSRPSLSSFGWNRRNLKAFLKNLADVKNGLPVEVLLGRIQDEWSLKRVVNRLVMYPLSLCMFALGLFLISTFIIYAVIFGVILIVLVSVWVYTDIAMLLKHKKDNMKKNEDEK